MMKGKMKIFILAGAYVVIGGLLEFYFFKKFGVVQWDISNPNTRIVIFVAAVYLLLPSILFDTIYLRMRKHHNGSENRSEKVRRKKPRLKSVMTAILVVEGIASAVAAAIIAYPYYVPDADDSKMEVFAGFASYVLLVVFFIVVAFKIITIVRAVDIIGLYILAVLLLPVVQLAVSCAVSFTFIFFSLIWFITLPIAAIYIISAVASFIGDLFEGEPYYIDSPLGNGKIRVDGRFCPSKFIKDELDKSSSIFHCMTTEEFIRYRMNIYEIYERECNIRLKDWKSYVMPDETQRELFEIYHEIRDRYSYPGLSKKIYEELFSEFISWDISFLDKAQNYYIDRYFGNNITDDSD